MTLCQGTSAIALQLFGVIRIAASGGIFTAEIPRNVSDEGRRRLYLDFARLRRKPVGVLMLPESVPSGLLLQKHADWLVKVIEGFTLQDENLYAQHVKLATRLKLR